MYAETIATELYIHKLLKVFSSWYTLYIYTLSMYIANSYTAWIYNVASS